MRVHHEPSLSHLRRAAGKDSPLVFRSCRGGTQMYEGRGLPNPNTPDQQASRGAWSLASAAWCELAPEEKSRWNSFAATRGRFFPERRSAEPLTGYRLFQGAAGNRQILGLPMPVQAPDQLPPEGLRGVELLPSAEADTLRLRLRHGLQGDAFRVVVSMSPPTLRASRKPDRRAGRHVRGWGEASTVPLPESGGEITFTGCRYAVAPGQRFGVWVRVVRESDGLGSPESFLDVIRPEPEDGAMSSSDPAARHLPGKETDRKTDGEPAKTDGDEGTDPEPHEKRVLSPLRPFRCGRAINGDPGGSFRSGLSETLGSDQKLPPDLEPFAPPVPGGRVHGASASSLPPSRALRYVFLRVRCRSAGNPSCRSRPGLWRNADLLAREFLLRS